MSKKIFLKVWSNNTFIKFLLIMEKRTSKFLIELLKAIAYAVLGAFGGNAVM